MRTILGLLMLGATGYLIWHGINSHESARVEFETQKATRKFDTLQQRYPYAGPAIDAREVVLERQIADNEKAAETRKAVSKEELKDLAMDLPSRTKKGISTEPPYLHPEAAAIIGVLGLLLALILPGTKFRGLAFLGLLIGGGAALAGMLPIETQVALVQKVSPLKYVITSFPRVAQACLALAGVTLLARVRPTVRPS